MLARTWAEMEPPLPHKPLTHTTAHQVAETLG